MDRKISREEAQKIAEEKFGNGVYVGDLYEVWEEAYKRAESEGKRKPGKIRTERLDGTQWNDECDSWALPQDEPTFLLDERNHYWFVLMQDYYISPALRLEDI